MRLLLLSLLLVLSACNEAPVPAPLPEPPITEALNENTMAMWARSCALCHVTGVAGAPRAGQADDWQERLAQGRGVLLKHTIEGKGMMPPLGYCMACEESDFIQMIDFMSGQVSP